MADLVVTRVCDGGGTFLNTLEMGIRLGTKGLWYNLMDDGESVLYANSNMILTDEMIGALYQMSLEDGEHIDAPSWLEIDYEEGTVTNTLTGLIGKFVSYCEL